MHLLGWIIYGVTSVAIYEFVDNPTPNTIGLVDEIDSFPYVVPDGYNLIINSMGIEGPGPSSADGNQVGIALWIGDLPCTNDKSIMSCTTPAGSTQLTGLKFIIPSGKKVNMRMMNNTPYAWANGWYIQGELVEN
jgi:hypothetical protein